MTTFTDLMANQLTGAVRSVKTYYYRREEDKEILSYADFILFNEQGKITEKKEFNEQEKLIVRESRQFDEDGHLKSVFEYDELGNQVGRSEFIRKPDERLTIWQVWGPDESINFDLSNKYFLDENGKVRSLVWYAEPGIIRSRYEYYYDEHGNQVKEEIFGTDGSLENTSYIEYDEAGNEILRKIIDGKGNITDTMIFEFNAEGRMERVQRSMWNGQALSGSTYEYDEYGSISRHIFQDFTEEEKEVSEYRYEYDEKGNWIHKEDWTNGLPSGCIRRELTYFR